MYLLYSYIALQLQPPPRTSIVAYAKTMKLSIRINTVVLLVAATVMMLLCGVIVSVGGADTKLGTTTGRAPHDLLDSPLSSSHSSYLKKGDRTDRADYVSSGTKHAAPRSLQQQDDAQAQGNILQTLLLVGLFYKFLEICRLNELGELETSKISLFRFLWLRISKSQNAGACPAPAPSPTPPSP
jgi:hypothetical protein